MTDGVLSGPVEAVQTAASLLRVVGAVEAWAVPGEEAMALVSALEQAQRTLDAARAHALSVLEATGACEQLGHRSVAGWAAHDGHLPRSLTRFHSRVARRLRGMPHTAAALAHARIAISHVDVLIRANTPSRAERFAEHEQMLVGFATSLPFKDFVTAVAYWRNAADPDAAADEAADRCAKRRVHSSRTLDGMGRLDAWLDPIGHATFDNELNRLAEVEFHRDWTAAKALHGDTVTVDQLARTAAQRRADALVEMATRSAATPANARRPEPLVVIVTDQATAEAAAAHHANPATTHPWPATGTCRLEDGTTLTPDEMFEQLLLGRFRRLLLDARGTIVDYGRSQRLYRGSLREAIQIRDGTCTFEGCELPARRCHIDHIDPWGGGGPTNGHNGRVYCNYHNQRRRRVEGLLHPEHDPHTHSVNWITPDD